LTTDRQRRANRANAKSSTGPRTTAGKTRVAQNALRHGLPIWSDPALLPMAEALARRIAGPDTDADALEHARRIAEAQVDLDRVRGRRRRLITGLLTNPKYQPLRVLIMRQQLRLMKTIDRVERIRGAPFEIDEIEEMIYLEPLEADAKLAAVVEDESSRLARA
jgi:hypothetical protein